MDRVDAVVIGAGVVGLAVARALAQAGREVIILEAAEGIGTGTSSRNSEVIHAGIYYPQGSLKARSCVAGRDRLYAYLAERGLPHRRCGKLIVATSAAQVGELERLQRVGHGNGVTDLMMIGRAEALALEPELRCEAALLSPSSGIVDSHALMLSLLGEAEAAGAMLAIHTPVVSGEVTGGGILLRTGGAEPMELVAGLVVNSAGLHASEVAAVIDGVPPDSIPRTWYAKGNYYALIGRSPFSHLVYPVPELAGLGVHVTLDLAGQARFGPDVEWVDQLNYDVDPRRADSFYAAVRLYWPALKDGALVPAYSGIRPKLQRPGEPQRDFVIQGPAEHGIPGLVNLYGIESPGLTASLDLADRVLATT